MYGAIVPYRLANQGIAASDGLVRQIGRQGIACETAEPIGAFGDVNRPDLRAQILREKAHDVIAEHLQSLVALDALAESHLSNPQPGLQLPRPVVARDEGCSGRDEYQQDPAPIQVTPVDKSRRLLPFLLSLHELRAVGVLHLIDEGADRSISTLPRSVFTIASASSALPRPFQRDGAEHFSELGGYQSLQLIQTLLLLGICCRKYRVTLFSSPLIAALPEIRVRDRLHRR